MASASESSQWADPVASARDLIASLEGARRHCEAEMGALSEEREHVLRAMSRAAQLLAVRRSKIDALADQERALDDAVSRMEENMVQVRQVTAHFQETAHEFRHIQTPGARS